MLWSTARLDRRGRASLAWLIGVLALLTGAVPLGGALARPDTPHAVNRADAPRTDPGPHDAAAEVQARPAVHVDSSPPTERRPIVDRAAAVPPPAAPRAVDCGMAAARALISPAPGAVDRTVRSGRAPPAAPGTGA